MKLSKKAFGLTLVALFASVAALADETKQARSNDYAISYTLTDSGRLYRTMPNGNQCDITTNVSDFKVSQHPKDAAVIYFKKEGNLYYLKNLSWKQASKPCPGAEKAVLMSDVKKYNVISNTNTDLVNTALSYGGRFAAWPNSGSPVSFDGISAYSLNNCYGKKDRSFNTYMVFLLTNGGKIVKVRGNASGYGSIEYKVDDSKYWQSPEQFIRQNNVCN